MFAGASLGLLPVILSGIKYCESQEGTLSLTQLNALMRHVWGIVQLPTTHKTTVHHYASDQIIQDLSPFFGAVCNKKLGRRLGARLDYCTALLRTFLVSMFDSITILLFHCTGHNGIEDAIPKWQQLALHQREIKDAVLVVNKRTFH